MKPITILLIAVILLAAGCTPPAPSVTPTQTPWPGPAWRPLTATSPTSTAIPPLVIHKWHPKPVLVKLDFGAGDNCCQYSYPPAFVLYATGRLILMDYFQDGTDGRHRLLTKLYSRQETCSILNTIDQMGFLDYNVHDYRPQGSDYFSIESAGTTEITVNAWKSNGGEFYGLSSYLELLHPLTLPGSPPIPPALRNLYYFLSAYPSRGLEPYQPQRLGLVALKPYDAQSGTPASDWPFDEFSLADIAEFTSPKGYPSRFFIVEGKPALSIYAFLDNSFDYDYAKNVWQNGQKYIVFARPILPYEIPRFHARNILPDPGRESPGFNLECYPSDGILHIPAP